MTQYQPHIRLSPSMTKAKYAILPGDPKRVGAVGQYLDNVEELACNREYRSLRGWYQGTEILVISTGMGGPSMAIAVEELNNIGITNLIRIGSCGALQKTIKLGELVLASGVVRDDGTSKAYVDLGYPAVADIELLSQLRLCSKKANYTTHTGFIRSHDSFYTDREQEICDYWSHKDILAADMETSALFVVGSLRKMRTASILNVVVEYQGDLESSINNYQDQEACCQSGEQREILLALNTVIADTHSA